ncbi:MAG: response regulator [Polyangiaceae bacterium]|nr:response regulator [Polyangiaceae bacterium]
MSRRSEQADILIVDDHPTSRALLSAILTEDGHHVRTAATGDEAVRTAVSTPPDLMLLDVNMPGKNGYDVCRTLQGESSTESIPIIFISALDAIGDKVMAFEAGGADYITKPFQVREVCARVRTQLALRRARIALHEAEHELAERDRQIDEMRFALQTQDSPASAPASQIPPPPQTTVTRPVLTVIATGIHGLTRLAEETNPEEFVSSLHQYLALNAASLTAHQAEIKRLDCDGIVAFFKDAAVGYTGAAALQRDIAVWNHARESTQKMTFSTRIGVATGPTLLAESKSRHRREILLIGDAPRVAMRFQADARPGSVLLDSTTYNAAGQPAEARHIAMRVRGKTEMVRAHELPPIRHFK